MTPETWLARHPYLEPFAHVHAIVEGAAAAVPVPGVPVPRWDDYAGDFHAGVPLIQSARAAIDLLPPEDAVRALIARLAASPLPGPLADQCRALDAELDGVSESPAHHGLFRYLAWMVLVRHLGSVVNAFDQWRNEDHWLRNYCPTCGEPPAMAQLVGTDPGRLRKLSCGCCRTRWRYRRTGCPFCDDQDEHRLAVVAVEGEAGLRIDYCDACGGYLKTYDGEGHESVLLADWTSLHLDLIARDRGLKRLAASLYEL
jgi:FdhE protein